MCEEERCRDLEKVKGRVLSHMMLGSLNPPRPALDDVAGQKAVVALETFLYEAFLCIRKGLLTNYLLPASVEPSILEEERKLTGSVSKC
jgi:hypothetical protein